MTASIYPVILCGGSGTRLWPLSRAMFPKQFIRFAGEGDESLLVATARRLGEAGGFKAPTFLCGNDQRFLLADDLAAAKIAPRALILEPVARNTAPAVALAALSVVAENPDGVMVVMPADHKISDATAFARAVTEAAAIAAGRRFVLFGIEPTEPHTGYGYIRAGAHHGAAREVAAFVEKPDAATAERYLAEGGYLWNSGIFVLHAGAFIDELERLAPAILSAARAALAAAKTDIGFCRVDADAYATAPAISIDYAVMEKTDKALVLPLAAQWSDIGAWSSLWEVSARDSAGNAMIGDTLVAGGAKGNYLHSERGMVAAIGVEDLVIVTTADATLVAPRARAQEVGDLVKAMKAGGRRETESHVRCHRPWGHFESLANGPRFQVKLLHVKPGAKLSMQMHHHRSEHWVVVKGTAKVTRNGAEKLVCENESVYFSATDWHRLENPGKVPLEIIEVQIGAYFGEDDIIRTDDIYHREPHETK